MDSTNISKKKSRLVVKNGVTANVHPPQKSVSFSNSRAKRNTNSIISSTSTMRKEGSKKMASSSCKSVKPGKKSFCTSYVGKEIQKLPKPSQSCYN